MKPATLPLIAAALLTPAACNPTVTIKQEQPFNINVNINGKLDLVVHDAKDDLANIKGEKPRNNVNLDDIGLGDPTPPAKTGAKNDALQSQDPFPTFLTIAHPQTRAGNNPGIRQTFLTATADELKAAMKSRDAAVQALWDSGTVGEGHDGLLTGKKALTPDQQKLVDTENADRAALYAAEAKQKNTPADQIALAYYVARLGYAQKGAWYEKKNAAGQWEWQQWSK